MKISGITVCYNSASTLTDTIKRVLTQTFGNMGYIIVDGGRKDATLDIIRRYEPEFGGRMRWISEKDHGLYGVPMDFFTMRTDGVSSSGWKSWKGGFQQRSKAMEKNGFKSGLILQLIGYILKIKHFFYMVILSK